MYYRLRSYGLYKVELKRHFEEKSPKCHKETPHLFALKMSTTNLQRVIKYFYWHKFYNPDKIRKIEIITKLTSQFFKGDLRYISSNIECCYRQDK